MMGAFDSPKSLSDEQRRHVKTMRILDEAQINACVDIKSVIILLMLTYIQFSCRDVQLNPLVARVNDAVIMTSTETVPRVTDDESVMETTHEPVVDIAPIDPLIDAKQEHIYRTESFYRKRICLLIETLQVHSLLRSRHGREQIRVISGETTAATLLAHDIHRASSCQFEVSVDRQRDTGQGVDASVRWCCCSGDADIKGVFMVVKRHNELLTSHRQAIGCHRRR